MKAPVKNRLEWAVFAASLVVIAAVMGVLVRYELSRPDTRPELHVRMTGTRATADGFAVAVEVRNSGGQTAQNVRIEAVLTGSDGTTERGELSLPRIPHGGTRGGEVVFPRDPAGGTLRARVLGYELD